MKSCCCYYYYTASFNQASREPSGVSETFDSSTYQYDMHEDKGRPLPKFGEWDVNNPASAEGFTVIFNKARDEKKTSGTPGPQASPGRANEGGGLKPDENYQYPTKNRKWFCCA